MKNLCLLALLLCGTVSCQRESRNFYVQPDQRRAVAGIRESDLIPDGAIAQPRVSLESASEFPRVNPYEGNAYAISEGEQLYNLFNCVGCHAHGGGAIGPALMDQNWLYGQTPEKVYESIVRGRPNGMPAWGGRIPEFQVWYLVTYVRSLGSLQPKSATPARSDQLPTGSEQPKAAAEDTPKVLP